jgi:hypothetical protein
MTYYIFSSEKFIDKNSVKYLQKQSMANATRRQRDGGRERERGVAIIS